MVMGLCAHIDIQHESCEWMGSRVSLVEDTVGGKLDLFVFFGKVPAKLQDLQIKLTVIKGIE